MQRITPLSVLAVALTWGVSPAAAQEADACVDEVQRLAESFSLEPGREVDAAIAQAPSARKGASLGNEQRRQIGELVEAARNAGEQGDGAGCVQRLSEARLLLRQAGIGSGQPGSANLPSAATAPGGSSPQGVAGGAATTLPGGTAAGAAGTGAATGGAEPAAGGGLNSSSALAGGRTGGGPRGDGTGGLTGGTVGGPTSGILGGASGSGDIGGASGGNSSSSSSGSSGGSN
jgi:hypothetical protein